MPFTVGGGVKKIEDINLLLKNGADKVSINTAAFHNRSFIKEAVKTFGSHDIFSLKHYCHSRPLGKQRSQRPSCEVDAERYDRHPP